jgi:hypothetical protein
MIEPPQGAEAERKQTIALYTAIGHFIVEFSQLEFMLRGTLGDALGIKDADPQFDIVVSPYDFATLCNVTKAVFTRTMGCTEEDKREIESILNDCLKLNNEERVPIAHGSWFIDASGLGARHVPRTKLEMTTRYERIADIDAAAQKAAKLKGRLIAFLLGPKWEWPKYGA